MKVSGFTFVRNALKYDYPVAESIRSLLPLADEMIVAVGNSEDETEQLIRGIGSAKIKSVPAIWDDSLREGGHVLAVETDKALAEVAADSDWAFYLQADEVIHENDYEKISSAMKKWKDDERVEGLLFHYKHFYGSYDYVADSRQWYRREIRIVRNNRSIHSWKDAQGFRRNNRKLNVKEVDATIYHYGWVKNPLQQQAKQKTFHKLWHNDQWVEEHVMKGDQFDYSGISSLAKFAGTHPAAMKERITKMNWRFDFDISKKNLSLKEKILRAVEKVTGRKPFEYKNYRII